MRQPGHMLIYREIYNMNVSNKIARASHIVISETYTDLEYQSSKRFKCYYIYLRKEAGLWSSWL